MSAGLPDKQKSAIEAEFFVVSLEDGFQAFVAARNRRMPLWRFNSSIWQRTAARIRASTHPILTIMDILSDLTTRLRIRPIDADTLHKKRFVHDLRYQIFCAIGVPLPRTKAARSVVIPPEVWQIATPDFLRGTVSGAGFSFAHVQIVMNDKFPEAKETAAYCAAPLPEIAQFPPSEATRLLWGVPTCPDASETVETTSTDAGPRKIGGRPTFKDEITAAFHMIEKDPSWSYKELLPLIKVQVHKATGIEHQKGWKDETIKNHLRALLKQPKAPKH